jgi:tRNA(fMet)-specific endonuclease VapC
MHCLDPDFLIEVVRGERSAVALLKQLERQERPTISAITAFEVTDTDRERDRALLVDFVGTFDIAVVDASVAIAAAQLSQALRARGRAIPPGDLLIAATCVLRGLTLVTRNRRHFDRIRGLRLRSW